MGRRDLQMKVRLFWRGGLKGWGDFRSGCAMLKKSSYHLWITSWCMFASQQGKTLLLFRARVEEETFNGVLGKAVDIQLLLIWAEVRWCSAAWDGRSGQSCWRGGSCSPARSWAPGRPGRWGAGGAAGREAQPWGPAAGRTGLLRGRTRTRRCRPEGQNGRKRSQRRLVICSGCRNKELS